MTSLAVERGAEGARGVAAEHVAPARVTVAEASEPLACGSAVSIRIISRNGSWVSTWTS